MLKFRDAEKSKKLLKTYSPREEKWNVMSHAAGLGLSVIGLLLLILKALQLGDGFHLISFVIFGASMVLLYAASTFYHNAKQERLRFRLKILDHASIYVLIAGTYTPFTLVTLEGTTGWILFGVVWSLAFLGVILKLFFTGRFTTLSTIMYVLMGWVMIFAIQPLMENLSAAGLYWLLAGGISYTIGAVIFSIHRIRYNHAIFHLFVLIGTFCHFVAIYSYVLPKE